MKGIDMNIYNSCQWNSDVENVMNSLPELSQLSGKSVMITGAAGLICSAIVDILFMFNDKHPNKSPITIIGAGRWIEEMEARFHEHIHRSDFIFVAYDAAKSDNSLPDDLEPSFIIHAASNAFPAMIMKEPVETILSNVNGIYDMLRLAKLHDAKRVLYVSSSEVYGKKENSDPYREGEYGFIDQLNPRNSYSIGKRAAENMCTSFASEYGVESVIVRPGHIYGPTASQQDTRVSSSFAWSAAKGQDIIMKSDGSQLRSYCHCLDCASAMLKVLLCGENGHAYNISNPDSIISIKEMAIELAKAGGVRLLKEAASKTELATYNPMDNSSLDSTSLQELGWEGLFNAHEGLFNTVKVMKEMLNAM